MSDKNSVKRLSRFQVLSTFYSDTSIVLKKKKQLFPNMNTFRAANSRRVLIEILDRPETFLNFYRF